MTGAALPFGHGSHDRRVRLNLVGERGVHLNRAQNNKYWRFVKFSRLPGAVVLIRILIGLPERIKIRNEEIFPACRI